ncbi:competence protein ComG [Oceanobacillus oncorhynchi subsp. incaldanensis]|uniref:Type IV pilin biogenesis protein n=2 Tax=Oceanobacillus TaxID=182709 RepID=A0A0A1MZE9_9BACI|nr:type II secretion system F family protein [Oceanobacillus oncorhynchi]MDM8099427.1 type II secretion system F family protein [Oceanobacillus oncorhynchi]UUI38449.1 type II secretion system F family protein [Oceanobacillus oncorhynchi]GIO20950.1 competence protein ComG [Oceanobacillus oncorhynchi subsp. incaldanensis]CEI84131.1 type IV pilin biogenesis protein [Oceanobacillus oncorhynchi]
MALLKRFLPNNQRLTITTQLQFLHVLQRMLSRGLTLVHSLDAMKYYGELEHISKQVLSNLEAGKQLDEAMDQAGFHHSIVSYLFVVREKADIYERIEHCYQLFQQRVHYIRKFQQTVRYPLILMIIFSGLLFFIYSRVIPSFQQLMFGELPMLLQTVIFLSAWLGYSLLILLVFSTLVVLVWLFSRNNISLETKLSIYKRVPLYRSYVKRQTSFHFAALYSSLLQTGMPMKELLNYMSRQTKLPIISYYAKQMQLEYFKGRTIHGLLTTMEFLESHLTDILSSNMDAKSLAKDLAIYADISIDTMYQRLQKSIVYIQPVFFSIIGAFIILIYVSLMSPMFELMNTM